MQANRLAHWRCMAGNDDILNVEHFNTEKRALQTAQTLFYRKRFSIVLEFSLMKGERAPVNPGDGGKGSLILWCTHTSSLAEVSEFHKSSTILFHLTAMYVAWLSFSSNQLCVAPSEWWIQKTNYIFYVISFLYLKIYAHLGNGALTRPTLREKCGFSHFAGEMGANKRCTKMGASFHQSSPCQKYIYIYKLSPIGNKSI